MQNDIEDKIVHSVGQQKLRISPSLRWLIINPVFLCLEILAINMILITKFNLNETSFFGGFVFVIFSLVYFFLNFSQITPIQTLLLILSGMFEIITSLLSYNFGRYWIIMALVTSQIIVGLRYYQRTQIIAENKKIIIRSRDLLIDEISVEVSVKKIGGLFGFGDIILHYKNERYVVSGVYQPVEKRRILIDDFQVKPHIQYAPWEGTLIEFMIFIIVLIIGILSLFFNIFYRLDGVDISLRIILSIIFSLITLIIILNIRIPRIRKNPALDIMNLDLINTGMWTQIFKFNEKLVIKQLFRCGWGHNDYNKHRSPIIGVKKCGKWNPLILNLMHNIMLVYQMIGIHRRRIYEHQIEFIPRTYLTPGKSYRYLQEYVSKPLTEYNVPDDILEQFIELNNDLERAGLYIDDVHAGNVRLNINDRIRIVDGEIYTDGEVYIKNILVKGIDERIEGMESVLGCNRIIRWVDNRTSVNEIVYNKYK